MTHAPRSPRRYHARWVLPISHPALSHGTVVVHGDRIAWVGPRRDAPPGDDVELGDAILLPGLVNTHSHLELTAMRGFLEGLDFRHWIGRLTRARLEVLAGEALVDSSLLGIAEGLRAGITTYADTSESGAPMTAMIAMGVRGIMYREVFGPDPDPDVASAAIAELKERLAIHRACETPLVRAGISPHAPYSVSEPLFALAAELSRAESVPIAVHIAESRDESRLVQHGDGGFADWLRGRDIPLPMTARSPIALLERAGVLRSRPLLIHCVTVDPADIATIRAHDCAVTHCPASNAKLGHGIAPLRELLAAGVRTGLGSDSVASNNRMDVLEEARLASLLQRARHRRFDLMPASAMLELSTLGGARALDLDGEIGSLEPGKSADLAAFPLGGVRDVPVHDPADTLIHAIAGRPASFVAIAGRELVRDGEPRYDEADIIERNRRHGSALAGWAGYGSSDIILHQPPPSEP